MLITSFSPQDALAQAKRTFIRDAEAEATIRSFADPIFRAAGMNPGDISIRFVKDKALNAFVAGGRNIFLNTGLITTSSGPDALIGVIAHETGHIEGGHLTRTRAAMEDASTIQMIGTVLGAIAAAGTRDPRAAQALIMGSSAASRRKFMKYSRTQESSADQAAMRLLDATGRSAKGLADFLGTLENQSVLSPRLQDPYVQTHPMSHTRIATLQDFIQKSPNSDKVSPLHERLLFDRMVAKLFGYLEPLSKVLKRYPESDQSFAARYGRAIAHYRNAELDLALKLVAELMQESPNDPYLNELKGQMLFEHGRSSQALVAYQKAYQILPQEKLILIELARVELEMNDPKLLSSAIEHFRKAIRLGLNSSFSWRQLGIAYGRRGDMGLSSLALAEAELYMGQFPNAEYLAKRALKTLDKGTSSYLQAEDILLSIKALRESKAAAAK